MELSNNQKNHFLISANIVNIDCNARAKINPKIFSFQSRKIKCKNIKRGKGTVRKLDFIATAKSNHKMSYNNDIFISVQKTIQRLT